jgi:hypothetical protein
VNGKTAGNLILMTCICLIIFWVFMALRPAQAHRMTAQDYRAAHWCTWSAATVCTKWRARGGKFNCSPDNMSNSCKLQRAGVNDMQTLRLRNDRSR